MEVIQQYIILFIQIIWYIKEIIATATYQSVDGDIQ